MTPADVLRQAADRVDLRRYYERSGVELTTAENATECWLRELADEIEEES